MNNIIFQTNLLRGAQGPQGDTGTAEAIPSDGVIWYDGETAPVGFMETTAPSGISDIQDAVDVVSARVDEIEALPDGSTTADAELVDIRVGADGTSYATAGNAVRGQVTALDEKIDDTNETQDYTISANSIVGTAEGNPITITDGGNCNVRELVATLSPTQASGTPTPSNPLDISGVSTLTIDRAGRNLLDYATWSSETSAYRGTGTFENNGVTLTATSNDAYTEVRADMTPIRVLPNTNYVLSWEAETTVAGNVYLFDGSLNVIGNVYASRQYYDFTTPSNCTEIYFRVGVQTSGNTIHYRNIQLALGNTALTTYEPYQGTTLSLSLGSTVYGGSVDLRSGVLTVDRKMYAFDGSDDESWTAGGSNDSGIYNFYIDHAGDLSVDAGISNRLELQTTILSETTREGFFVNTNRIFLRLSSSRATTVAGLKTWLASNNVQICGVLSTPLTTQLTPQELRLLTGNNTLWTNAEGLEVEYVKDATTIINDILNRLEALEE